VPTSVFFYCAPYARPDDAAYQHLVVALAEGLVSLGVSVYANTDYWRRPDGSFLLRSDPDISAADCDAVVVSDVWFDSGNAMPPEIGRPSRSYATVYLDAQDGSHLHSYGAAWSGFDLVLRTHGIDDAANRANFAPWAFGLSERIIAATNVAPDAPRRNAAVFNFRHQRFPHSVRRAAERRIVPGLRKILEVDASLDGPDSSATELERMWWEQTGRRHARAYFERLRSSLACGAFGGYFVAGFPRDTSIAPARALKRALTATRIATRRIVQWDSWRFWEALAAGCAVFHVDLDRYGVRLPVAPTNWEHYIGFDMVAPKRALQRIADDPDVLARVGVAGRTWALSTYGPVPTARRFLRAIGRE
jgi:hypothetical protein